MKIAFMGTPAFAVAALRALVENGHEVVGVFTQPDRRKNRGMKQTASAVKEYALTIPLPVYQPERMRGEENATLLRSLKPDLTVVAAYGQILPEHILSAAPLGSVNIHASLLPKYRGAAPINWAIMNGETETGVTLMYMAKKLDAGDIITARNTPIGPNEDAVSLYDRLAILGAQLLVETLPVIERGEAARTPQDGSASSYAPMLTRELSPIDWRRSACSIHNQIRALTPWPCACTTMLGQMVKIWCAEYADSASSDATGIMRANPRGIVVSCGDGKELTITELQGESGKRMSANAWLNGKRISAGERFT